MAPVAAPEFKTCPTCNEKRPVSENFCRKDGSRLIQGGGCWRCHTTIGKEDAYCFFCGAPKDKPEQMTATTSTGVEIH